MNQGAHTTGLADELKMVIRHAARGPEKLEGRLPILTGFYAVERADDLGEEARLHIVLYRLIPEYLDRLPDGRSGQAIRELFKWRNQDGEAQSLSARFYKAADHLVVSPPDFGRRQEPRLLMECARHFIAFDQDDRLGAHSPDVVASRPLVATSLPTEDVHVHATLDYQLLFAQFARASKIVLVNAWIPDLDVLAAQLAEAVTRGAAISVLLLDPASKIALGNDRVRLGVLHTLAGLRAFPRHAGGKQLGHLDVRLSAELPSLSAYATDEWAVISVPSRARPAVAAVQIEVQGRESILGRFVFRELETLWELGHDDGMADQAGTAGIEADC